MKYLLMIYSNPENWEHPMFRHAPGFLALSREEQDEVVRQADEVWREIHESGGSWRESRSRIPASPGTYVAVTGCR